MKLAAVTLLLIIAANIAAARPLPASGPLVPQAVRAAPEGERVAIWYWGILIGQPKLCWSPANGFSPCY